MSVVRITVCAQGKAKLSVVVERDAQGRAAPAEELTEDDGVECPRCVLEDDPGSCVTMRVCHGLFAYFNDVASVTRANVILASGKHRFAFCGSSQVVAALSILAGFVASACGRFSGYSFLLRCLCDPSRNGEPSASLKWLEASSAHGLSRASPATDPQAWRERYLRFVALKVTPAIYLFEQHHGKDTLRNACQILYSLAWVASSEQRL